MADAEPQDGFMYFDPVHNVKGESQDVEISKKSGFELTSFTFTGTNATNIGSSKSGAGGAGKVTFEKLQFNKPSDRATVGLIQAMILGTHFDKVTVVLRRNMVPYIEMVFHMCIVANVEFSQSGEEEGEDSVQLDWGAVEVKYSTQNKKGEFNVESEATWSRVTNEASTATGA